ncbi:MAG: glycoside hydrolase family 88 protein [Tannerella sp.]|jgi:rhamnogalacturonyl hydrolase YesR|nr:glycoside hydrolase family 88 protein [Tannerella sp.]
MKIKTLSIILSFCCLSAYSQTADLQNFPVGFTPKEVGDRLVKHYLTKQIAPKNGKYVAYPEVCTWLGSLWYADATGNDEMYNSLVSRFEPLFMEKKTLLPDPVHVDLTVFGSIPSEIYRRTHIAKYRDMGVGYAESQWRLPKDTSKLSKKTKDFAAKGYSWQTRLWIDDMFMITAVQTQTYMATGDLKYINRSAKEMSLYLKELQRPNGLFYHTPETPFYWARGNGWMAVGMAEILRMLPDDNDNKAVIMQGYRKMMQSLLDYQADDGMWRQLIDDPTSWKETSGTAMFLYAMITGVRNGWLDAQKYGAAVRKAWLTLVTYINENDDVTEICVGTGAKNDRQYYLDRKREAGNYHGQAPVIWCAYALTRQTELQWPSALTVMSKADGFKGIWYMNQPSKDEYKYKYSGGMAVYPANHRPFALYNKQTDRTFFCFGGTDAKNSTLYHNVSYFDHKTSKLARPYILLDKNTDDAHDNPVISIDDKGYIWIFSTSHGTGRTSYSHKSVKPHDIYDFERIYATEKVNGKDVAFNNFSYFQVYHIKNKGFIAVFTKYVKGHRVIGYNTSPDGVSWNEWQIIAHINMGHYQVSAEVNGKVCIAFDYHPNGKGLNYRTNLYYLESSDFGDTWQTRNGETVSLPLTTIDNPALVHDYTTPGLNCYLSDIALDDKGNPAILVVVSKGFESGPANDPREWTLFRYDKGWRHSVVTVSDNNYDMGSIYMLSNKKIAVTGPSVNGPQAYNTGGEVATMISNDNSKTWKMQRQLTNNSPRNHNYVRRPLYAHPAFLSIWADGHGRQPSESYLYFSDAKNNVFRMPRDFTADFATPEAVKPLAGF